MGQQKFKGIDTIHHITMRGARGVSIVENDRDRWDFVKLLYYLNDEYKNNQWERDIKRSDCKLFERPNHWPERDPLVLICAFCLLDNHFHLLIKEIKEGGISQFMHRLPNSMTHRYNINYDGVGSIFQGTYNSRMIENQADLINVGLYVTVKNVFERYPDGGIEGTLEGFETAHKWALEDQFSSYADFAGDRNSPLLEKDILGNTFASKSKFKKEAQEYLTMYAAGKKEHSEHLFLE